MPIVGMFVGEQGSAWSAGHDWSAATQPHMQWAAMHCVFWHHSIASLAGSMGESLRCWLHDLGDYQFPLHLHKDSDNIKMSQIQVQVTTHGILTKPYYTELYRQNSTQTTKSKINRNIAGVTCTKETSCGGDGGGCCASATILQKAKKETIHQQDHTVRRCISGHAVY